MRLKKPLPKPTPMADVWMRTIKDMAQAMRCSERQAALHIMAMIREEACRLEELERQNEG